MYRIIIVLCLLSAGAGLSAQDLSAYSVAPAGSVSFSQPGFTHPDNNTKTEDPPWIIAGGWRTYFFTDGIGSTVGSSPLDMIHNDQITISEGPFTSSSPDGCTAANMFPWRRNYYGIVSAQTFYHPTAGQVSLGFLHGENYSVIGVNQPAVACGGVGYPSYAAFVCGSWLPNTQATDWGQGYFTDLGPLVWPSSGYLLPSGQKSSLGVAEPTSIQADDGYLYLFYKDMSHYRVPAYDSIQGRPGSGVYYAGDPDFPSEPGRLPGMKVARAPISDALNPQAYKSFYEDASGVHWNPSLPDGFTMSNTTAFLRTPGPQATNILGTADHFDYGRFSVAKVKGTNYYFGVASYQDYDDPWGYDDQGHPKPKLKVSLRFSYDLVHWSGNRVIDEVPDWTTTHFDYPIFLSSDGWSNNSIDANDFYVVGTAPYPHPQGLVYRKEIYIPAPIPPDPPPSDPGTFPCPNDPSTMCSTRADGTVVSASAAVLDASPGRAPYVYPNPGPGVFTLNYTLKDHAITQLNVLDVTGRQLQTGATTMRAPGRYTETVNISSRARGVYLLELLVNGGKKTFKVIYQ